MSVNVSSVTDFGQVWTEFYKLNLRVDFLFVFWWKFLLIYQKVLLGEFDIVKLIDGAQEKNW